MADQVAGPEGRRTAHAAVPAADQGIQALAEHTAQAAVVPVSKPPWALQHVPLYVLPESNRG